MPWASTACQQTPTTAVSRIWKVLSLLVSSQHEEKITKIKSLLVHSGLVLFFCLQCNTSCFEFYSQRFYCKKQQWVFKEKHFSEDAEWTDTVTHVCHRALQTSMVNPNVLGVRNLEQISFLKNHVLLECLSSTSVARQVNSFTPGY